MLIRRLVTAFVCVVSVSVSGCGKESGDKKKAAPAPTEAPAEAAKPKPSEPPFGEFDIDALRDEMQGAWLIAIPNAGREAWQVDGDKVTIAAGKEQIEGSIKITSPCSLELTFERGGKKSVNSYNFAFGKDTLHIGAGNVGLRQDELVLGCFGNVWYEYRAPDCTKWELDEGAWKSSTILCKIDDAGGQTSFRVTNDDGETIGIWGSGDELMDGELRKHESKRGDSLDNVVKAIAALEKAEAKEKKKKKR